MEIDHFLHTRHPLKLIEEVNNKFVCHGCDKSLSPGLIYGCRCSGCEFYLHKACSELPQHLQHFLHRCTLVLDTTSSFKCHACFKHGHGFTYFCIFCRFYMHVECALRPPKPNIESADKKIIKQYFSHGHGTCHRLTLVDENRKNGIHFVHRHLYHCGRCRFDMHVECALRPTIKSIGDWDCEEIVEHFTHWHPLTLIDENEKKDLQVGCGICEKLICFDSGSGSTVYGCKECNFFVHKSCMINIPRQINDHLFHPSCPLILLTTTQYKCAGCDEKHSGLVFRCAKHSFQLDLKCALAPTLDQSSSSKDADRILYIGHTHALLALRNNNKADDDITASEVAHHPCGVCGEKCSLEILDEDPCFGCKRCDLLLHKSCLMNTPRQINDHVFHPSSCGPLILLTTPSSFKCAGCDDEHVSSLAYSCAKCGFQLDGKCALLQTLHHYSSKDAANKIQYAAHKHPLIALHHQNKDDIDRCGVCREKCSLELDDDDPCCFGCERCQFFIHRQCAFQFTAEPEIHHYYFHPLHPLTLSSLQTSTKIGRCSACLGWIDEFLLVYRCAKCNFNLHVDCAKPKLAATTRDLLVKYEGHSHHLKFFDKTCINATSCCICNQNTARNCIFRCVACKFDMHLYCHPSAPKTVKHNCHLHPLSLTESPFEFELISPQYQGEDSESDDEFYCDVCEEKRDKYESVYYCKKCKFIAETRCVISELLPSITGSEGHHTREGKVISIDEESSALEASISKRTNEIAELRKEKKPLELEIEKRKAELQELEMKHNAITGKLDEFETDRVLWNYQLNHNLGGKYKATSEEASTSVDEDTHTSKEQQNQMEDKIIPPAATMELEAILQQVEDWLEIPIPAAVSDGIDNL
ncbi:Zinc finger, PHD-type [Corchorus olitorius]|uniref:Zinc finger, PHD-type n=1 Tax=Corchorus olitorius TaxID=93759 RepID=A0A1R3KSW7_9ROSI|nr:Zinc finger, PHD-type [Corchorus olitorius]